MATAELSDLPEGRVLLVKTFEDFTKMPGDSWMSVGIRDYLTSCLRAADSLRVVSGTTANAQITSGGADFTVEGKFQHLGENLRVFINLTDGSGTLLKQFALTFPYPDNKEFFTKLAEAATQILGIADSKFDQKIIDAVRDATASTRAFESYIKGREELRKYTPSILAPAKRWFDDVKRIDYRSPLGYEGIIDLHTFLGFYNRQNGLPFASHFQAAQQELVEMLRLAKPAPLFMSRKKSKVTAKPKSQDLKIENKFILNNIAYLEAMTALDAGQNEESINAFKRAVAFLPEDPISWYYIALLEGRKKNTAEADQAMSKARLLNPCIRRP